MVNICQVAVQDLVPGVREVNDRIVLAVEAVALAAPLGGRQVSQNRVDLFVSETELAQHVSDGIPFRPLRHPAIMPLGELVGQGPGRCWAIPKMRYRLVFADDERADLDGQLGARSLRVT
jgi:hypothetical protein